MSKDDKSTLAVVLVIAGILVLAGLGQLYKAKVQQDVYRRGGVEMSLGEILLGAKPVERSIVPNPSAK